MEGVQEKHRSHRQLDSGDDSLRECLAVAAERLEGLSHECSRNGETPSGSTQKQVPVVPRIVTNEPKPEDFSERKTFDQRFRAMEEEISALRGPFGQEFKALREDLAEFTRTLTNTVPREEISRLKTEMRALSKQLDRAPTAEASRPSFSTMDAGLVEPRNISSAVAPADRSPNLKDEMRALSRKIEQFAASVPQIQDSSILYRLEQAVASLTSAISNITSDGTLAQLAAQVHTLAEKFERSTSGANSEILAKLDVAIASLVQHDRAMPSELEASIRSLNECVDRMRLSPSDELALGALEDRIAKLSEKLDASDTRLKCLGAIETGLADLLVHLEEMRHGGPHEPRTLASTEAAAPQQPAIPSVTEVSKPIEVSTLDKLATQPQAYAAAELVSPAPAPSKSAASQAVDRAPLPLTTASPPLANAVPSQSNASMQPAIPNRVPIDPNLPPDAPLEPGIGTLRTKLGSPAERIAASEAALGAARPKPAEHGGRSAAIAAARAALKASYAQSLEDEAKLRSGAIGNWIARRSKKAAGAPIATEPSDTPEPAAASETTVYPEFIGNADFDIPNAGEKRRSPRLKKLMIAACAAIIVIGSAHIALQFFWPEKSALSLIAKGLINSGPVTAKAPDSLVPSNSQVSSETAQNKLPPATSAADPSSTGAIDSSAVVFGTAIMTPPSALPPPAGAKQPPSTKPPANTAPPTRAQAQPSHAEATGAIPQTPLPRPVSSQATAPASEPASKSAPDVIGPVLAAALANNDPAAEYEMAVRYSEGRGVQRNFQESVRLLERASEAGFAPAQFRLAGLNEKGDGLKKDLHAARRLYLAAAAQGHAKAMHNLAVLFAEGVNGKPDYKAAAQWFRKAASYGITDSQYNLAILYARGIGIQSNLAESYKWFALAAAKGDQDAARKRDEVASRLDPQTIAAGNLAVQAFVPEREPEHATSLRIPPGGWDQTNAPTDRSRSSRQRRQRG